MAARELAEVHRLAQERLGLFGALVTLDEWHNINTVKPKKTPISWFRRLFGFLSPIRRTNHQLASRYYNLARALEAGEALPNPFGVPYGPNVTVAQLYDDMGETLREVIHHPANRQHVATLHDKSNPSGIESQKDELDQQLNVLVDDLEKLFSDLREKYEPLFEASVPIDENFQWPQVVEDDYRLLHRDIKTDLSTLEKKISIIESDKETEPQGLRVQINDQARMRSYESAGATSQAVMEPGRYLVDQMIRTDPKIKGWARATGPHPCAFCAMLASRGAVYHTKPDFHTHVHCQCQAVPVFTDDYAQSKRDRFFEKLWGDSTGAVQSFSGYGRDGKRRYYGKLNAFRKALNKQYAAGNVPDQDIYGPARP